MFDLDAYLRRIGADIPREATPAVLTAVCAAHPAALAFENIDSLLGRVPLLTPAALMAKLVHQRRGGYCYEQNALLRLALEALGFRVTGLAARVVWGQRLEAPPRAPSHMLLRVALPSRGDDEADLESFLVDAGFGGHLLGAPLKLEPGLVQATPGGVERLTQAGETFTLEALLPDGWAPAYRFTLAPLAPVDYEPLNWFTVTHPDSFFRHNLRLERLTPRQRAGLLNDRLTLRPAIGEATVRRLESAADFAEVLETVFALTPPIAADELFERVPKGLDGPFVPG